MSRQMALSVREQVRPVLVDVDETASRLGYSWQSVLGMVDSGELLWVWDVSLVRSASSRHRRRELRFWMGEVLAPGLHRDRSIEEVIGWVIGRDPAIRELRSVGVGNTLRLRAQQMKGLVEAGELVGRMGGHTRWIERGSLEGFLKRRWVGGV